LLPLRSSRSHCLSIGVGEAGQRVQGGGLVDEVNVRVSAEGQFWVAVSRHGLHHARMHARPRQIRQERVSQRMEVEDPPRLVAVAEEQ
jgi:hypothetical protein